MKRATAGEDISTDLWESGVRPWIRAGGMRHVLSFCSSDNQRKVCTVILEVLDTLPPDDLALFLRTNPFFVCLDVSQGAALRFPPDGQGDGYVSMIYLHPGTFRRPADRIADLVAHEVAHLGHMNHGPRFWALVERTMQRHEEARSWLRKRG